MLGFAQVEPKCEAEWVHAKDDNTATPAHDNCYLLV